MPLSPFQGEAAGQGSVLDADGGRIFSDIGKAGNFSDIPRGTMGNDVAIRAIGGDK